MVEKTIADQVAEMGRALAEQPADPRMETFAAEQQTLREGGRAAGIAEPGGPLPDVELIDVTGAPVTLGDVLGGVPAVVVFYRGGWCPYCNLALATYQRQLQPALIDRGAKMIAVSPQRPDGSLSVQEKHELTFPVLSDPGNALASMLGIAITPASNVIAAQRELGLDLTEINADGTVTIPMPTTLVVDAERTIRWIDVHPDYSTRSEVADILAALDEVVAR